MARTPTPREPRRASVPTDALAPPPSLTRSRLLGPGFLALGLTALGALAARQPASPAVVPAPSSGGLWTLDATRGLLARVHLDARRVDALVPAAAGTTAVLSTAHALLQLGPAGLTPVDPCTLRQGLPFTLPEGSRIALGADRLAVATPDGAVHVLDATALPPGGLTSVAPAHRAATGPCPIVVDLHGGAHLLDGTTLHSLPRRDVASESIPRSAIDLPGLTADPAALELSTVEEHPIVLDREHRLLRTAGRVLDPSRHGITDLASARLQRPGPDAADILVATGDALIALPRDGSAPRRRPAGASAVPLPPVRTRQGACGVWQDPARVLRCGPEHAPQLFDLPSLPADASLALHAQGDLLLLEDRRSGWCHVLDEDPASLELGPELTILQEQRR